MPDKTVHHLEGHLQARAALFYFPRAVTVPAPAADVGLCFTQCHSPCALRRNQVLKNRVKSVGVVSTSCVWCQPGWHQLWAGAGLWLSSPPPKDVLSLKTRRFSSLCWHSELLCFISSIHFMSTLTLPQRVVIPEAQGVPEAVCFLSVPLSNKPVWVMGLEGARAHAVTVVQARIRTWRCPFLHPLLEHTDSRLSHRVRAGSLEFGGHIKCHAKATSGSTHCLYHGHPEDLGISSGYTQPLGLIRGTSTTLLLSEALCIG